MKDIVRLFEKYRNNSCSAEEVEDLLDHFKLVDQKELLTALIEKHLSSSFMDSAELESSANQVYEKLKSTIFNDDISGRLGWKAPVIKWLLAASITVVVGLGVYLSSSDESLETLKTENHVTKNDVLPGKNGATLTLSNGKKIILSNASVGDIAEEAGIEISKSANGQIIYKMASTADGKVDRINILSTSRGEQSQLQLPDGSKVWLNAASQITYSSAFGSTSPRQIELEGEAYFEVAKNIKKPFTVKLKNNVIIEVLGTHFNVMAYNDEESSKTTLLEGSVKVQQGKVARVIRPGEQFDNYKSGASSKVVSVDVDEAIAWKRGVFRFNNTDLPTIMRQISRWYDVDIEYEGKIANELMFGTISRKQNLSQVLKILELNDIKFLVERRKITVRQ